MDSNCVNFIYNFSIVLLKIFAILKNILELLKIYVLLHPCTLIKNIFSILCLPTPDYLLSITG